MGLLMLLMKGYRQQCQETAEGTRCVSAEVTSCTRGQRQGKSRRRRAGPWKYPPGGVVEGQQEAPTEHKACLVLTLPSRSGCLPRLLSAHLPEDSWPNRNRKGEVVVRAQDNSC
ncbi:hypothetical protein AMECASPLE_023772 [Ameca splendens]|uniref:Uncharacterized protein n=1 Tax=Ameca splendens TaxID=208324 RepID=A0ABV0YRD2_9TELE